MSDTTNKYPRSEEIIWENMFRFNSEVTYKHKLGLCKFHNVTTTGTRLKTVYEGVETIAAEQNVPVENVWGELAIYEPTNGFMFDTNQDSPYSKLKPYINTQGDSGASYGCFMRTIQDVAKNGIDPKYIKTNRSVLKTTFVFLGFAVFIGKLLYDQ